MTEEVQPVEEVEIEGVAQPEQTLEVETAETETDEETQEPSTEIDEETKQKEEARQHFQERQTRREREEQLQRENEYLRQQLMGGGQNSQLPQQSQQPTQQYQASNEPDLDVYLENGYTAQQFFKAHREWEKKEDARASAEHEVVSTYAQQMKSYAESVPDVYAYAKEADRLVAPAVQDAILRSAKAPEIIEKIALDPKYATELNNSRDVFDLARKIAQFENSQPKVKASISSAPRPPSTPKSEPVITAQTDISKLSHAEYAKYAKYRDAQRNNRR